MRALLKFKFVRVAERLEFFLSLTILSSGLIASCMTQAAQENQRILQQQQAELVQMQRDITRLQAQLAGPNPAPAAGTVTPVPPAACDEQLAAKASQNGAKAMKGGNLRSALSYYQDAAAACPKNAEFELKLGQVYEAMGQRAFAREHYRRAEVLAVQNSPDIADRARKALAHLTPQE
jgi:tetratricopeptide (TPR) repeat protein